MTASPPTSPPTAAAAQTHAALLAVLGDRAVVPVALVATLCDGDHAAAATVLDDLVTARLAHAPRGTRAGEEKFRIVRGADPRRAGTGDAHERAAREKIIDWFAARAAGAAHEMNIRSWWADPEHPWHAQARPFDPETDATVWYDEHRDRLRALLHSAAEHRLTDLTWRFAEVLADLELARRCHHEVLEFADLGLRVLDAGSATPDPTACAALHARRVLALAALGRHDQARRAATPVKHFAKNTTDHYPAVSAAWSIVAEAARAAGKPDRSLTYRVRALRAALRCRDRDLLASHISRTREAMEAVLGTNASAVTTLINAHLQLIPLAAFQQVASAPEQPPAPADTTTSTAPQDAPGPHPTRRVRS